MEGDCDGGGGVGFGGNNLSSSSNIGGLMMMMPPPPRSSTLTTNNSSSSPNPNHNRPFFFPPTSSSNPNHHSSRDNYFMDADVGGSSSNTTNTTNRSSSEAALKAKIMSHPHYHRLVAAYVNCQKVGAPPEVVEKLERACAGLSTITTGSGRLGEDPGLDQFMEAYCEMLTKYELELSKPFKEAMAFLSRIESQFKALTLSSSSDSPAYGQSSDGNGSSDEDVDVHNDLIDPQAEDRELKGQLLRKYSGYLGSLKQEFMKRRKKGKLPKEARQQLLDWWTRHYKWPYPSESQKLALAESTGLDQKQINNWFINQRKRHWKPSEDMQFVVMDAAHPHYYMDNAMGNPYPMDISPGYL
uniref:Uncharacterized protein n=1 Tax=Kalanchoe fedtschenkoi TaxID=63787 RepID=A0A7N0RER8_KALFE